MEIYCLKDKDNSFLNPSVQATILAKYSRSPDSARNVVSSLSVEEANKFHSKWTINYGHSSVAELATIPICFEGVSMIASKFIEKFQRPGYSEKSTRYQKFSRDSFVNPIENHSNTLRNFVNRFYDAYEEMLPAALNRAANLMGEDNIELPKVKARAYDSLRYLLPAGTGTNLAAVMNLRDVRYLVSEALGNSNPEIRRIGLEVLRVASAECPALLSNTHPDSFEPALKGIFDVDKRNSHEAGVRLLRHDPDGERIIKNFVSKTYWMSWEAFEAHMKNRGNHKVPNVFKLIDVTFEIIMDYGAYRDLQRHRRCEQFPEYLTPFYGYSIPDDFKDTPLEAKYRALMDQVLSYDDDIVINDRDIYQYIIPMGYHHCSIFKMDLAELYYMIELRTKEQGHISYRRIVYNMFEEVSKVYPNLMKYCNVIKPTAIGAHL